MYIWCSKVLCMYRVYVFLNFLLSLSEAMKHRAYVFGYISKPVNSLGTQFDCATRLYAPDIRLIA